VRELGVWDSNGDGLKAAHSVTLFSLDKVGMGAKATAVPGGSVTVLIGTSAALEAGHQSLVRRRPKALSKRACGVKGV